MRNKISKLIFAIVGILIITILLSTNILYASFAEFDDETADKQANEDLKEQEAIDKANQGKSSNNYLEQLSVKGYEITPEFNKQTINYSIEKEITDNELEIIATSADNKATINGDGKVKLQSGENELRLDVVAENGITRTYFIKVTKKIEAINLTSLKLIAVNSNNNTEEVELLPDFDTGKFEYNCTVYNDITKINVEALSNQEANIEIIGNENLQVGSNTITITVKSKSDESETIYKVNVIRKEREQISNNTTNNTLKIVLAIILLIVAVMIIVLLSKKTHKSKH